MGTKLGLPVGLGVGTAVGLPGNGVGSEVGRSEGVAVVGTAEGVGEGASVGGKEGAEEGSRTATTVWVDRVASWIESPDPVVPTSRRPLTTPMLLLLNSVFGTVQEHVVCVASYEVILHFVCDVANVAVDVTRRPQVGMTMMPGHSCGTTR